MTMTSNRTGEEGSFLEINSNESPISSAIRAAESSFPLLPLRYQTFLNIIAIHSGATYQDCRTAIQQLENMGVLEYIDSKALLRLAY